MGFSTPPFPAACRSPGSGSSILFSRWGVLCMRLISWSRGALGLACLLASASATVHTQAASPDRPVRVILPFPASGAPELGARVGAPRGAAGLGQQMVVDNKPGAGGTIGTAEAAKAPADGYTLLLTTSSTHAISPHLMPRL